MREAPHRTGQRARRGLSPLAMSALLAFAFFPGFAVAQDSSGIQYSDAPPTLPGKNSGGDADRKAGTGADGSDQSSTRSGSTGDSTRKKGSGDGSGAAGKAGDESDGKGGAAGRPGDGQGGDGERVGGPIETDTAASEGGSSPLVPILIALAVLAAISVAVVAMRKKRQDADPGAPASPEAG